MTSRQPVKTARAMIAKFGGRAALECDRRAERANMNGASEREDFYRRVVQEIDKIATANLMLGSR